MGALSRPILCWSTPITATALLATSRLFKYGLTGDLGQYATALRHPDPSGSKLGELLLHLRPDKEATKLLGRNPRRPRSTERVEDEIPLLGRGQNGAADETQRFLRRVVAIKLLPLRHGLNAPDGGHLGARVSAVYEVVVEGVLGAFTLARPQDCFVGVSKGSVEGIRGRVGFLPGDLVYELVPDALQGEAEAEDDVVRARNPDGAFGFEDAVRLLQPPDVEPVVPCESCRPAPGTFVYGSEPPVPDRHAAGREPIRRVGEDHVHAACGYDLHEIHTVCQVDYRPWFAERLEVA